MLRATEIFHFCVYYQVHILYQRQTNSCQNTTFSCVLTAHITLKVKTYYSEGKDIFFEIFRHKQLPKYSVFTCISCAFYTEGKAIFSETFWHQQLLKYSIFMCIDCTYYSEGKQYSRKCSSTNCCQNISFSPRFSAHVPQATYNIPWSISPSRANLIFTCIE